MKTINDVTLVAVATTDIEATVRALEYSAKDLGFGRILLIASENPRGSKNSVYDYVQIRPFASVGEWGRFIVFELHKYIETEFILLIHADGFVVHPHKWEDNFLNYDYIGAPWPIPKDLFSFRDYYGNIIRVGNSVSLRSKKLLRLPTELGMEWTNFDCGFAHEDGYLCVQHRHTLQMQGVKYAPLNVACAFSRERTIPENKNITPFAFHKWHGKNKYYPYFGGHQNLRMKVLNGVKKMKRFLINE